MTLEIKGYPCHDFSYVTLKVSDVKYNPNNRATNWDQLRVERVANSEGKIEYHLANTDPETMRRSRGAKYLDVAVIEDSAKTLQALSNRDGGYTVSAIVLGSHDGREPLRPWSMGEYQKLYDGPRPESGAASLTLKYSAGRDSDTGLMNYMVEAAEEGPKVTCFWHDKPNLLVLQHTLADNAFHIHEEWRKGTPTKNWALRMRSVRNPTQTPSDTDSAEEMYNFTIKPEMKNRFEKTGLGPELQVTVDIKFEKRDEGRDKYTEPRSRFYI